MVDCVFWTRTRTVFGTSTFMSLDFHSHSLILIWKLSNLLINIWQTQTQTHTNRKWLNDCIMKSGPISFAETICHFQRLWNWFVELFTFGFLFFSSSSFTGYLIWTMSLLINDLVSDTTVTYRICHENCLTIIFFFEWIEFFFFFSHSFFCNIILSDRIFRWVIE